MIPWLKGLISVVAPLLAKKNWEKSGAMVSQNGGKFNSFIKLLL